MGRSNYKLVSCLSLLINNLIIKPIKVPRQINVLRYQEAVVVQVVVAFPEAVVHLVQVVVAIPVVADLLYVPVEVDVKYSVLPCV